MKKITVICNFCHISVQKPLKEVTRQIREHGEGYKFYCARTCYQNYKDKTKSLRWQASHFRARYYYVTKVWGDNKIAQCDNCHKSVRVHRLEIHHKNADYLDNSPDNLAAVCKPCHYFIHEKQ